MRMKIGYRSKSEMIGEERKLQTKDTRTLAINYLKRCNLWNFKTCPSKKEILECLLENHPDQQVFIKEPLLVSMARILSNVDKIGVQNEINYILKQSDGNIQIKKRKKTIKCSTDPNRITNGKMTSKEFYNSDEWKQLRYKILVKYNATCMCCGRSAKDKIIIHVDHIKPRSLFPELCLDESNLQILCDECNLGKSNIDQTDWR